MMIYLKKFFSLCLVLALCLSLGTVALAAPVADATIDTSRTGSLDIYKYDFTNAAKDGVWDSSYVSTGVYDQVVNDALGNAIRAGDTDNSSDLGNGETSYGYAVKGVEFTYLRVADIVQFTESAADGAASNHVEVLYGIDKTNGADLLAAIGLADGAGRYENADNSDKLDHNNYYYQSDVLIDALRTSLEANATTVKNALENYVKANGGTALPLTDAYGHTSADGLPLGLYMIVETKVPDMVTSTCNPFLLSLPTTTIDGNEWNYDVTIYPKNATGMPDLEKTVREIKADTGKNEGKTDDILDGYDHVATASDGDRVEYQFLSHLPTITSEATNLTCYPFEDQLSPGIRYNKGDVVIEFYRDNRCEDKITSWGENDGKFTVSYPEATGGSRMTIEMTGAGLAEINGSGTVYGSDSIYSGFSECFMRITYACTVQSDESVVYGDTGNPNTVKLTWRRTSSEYYDVLEDDAHVYTYGIDLTKKFSDGAGKFENVKFIVQNKTDNYFLQAEGKDGVYYVTGHTADKEKATVFIPGKDGHIIIKGVEDDTYIATEIETDEGYTLLRDNITVEITAKRTDRCARCNAPLLTACAEVNKDKVTMLKDGESANAIVPLTVVNTQGFNLPQTGSRGIWMYSVFGVIAMGAAAFMIFRLMRKQKSMD